MREQELHASVERLGQRVRALVTELEESTRPSVATSWALRLVAKRMGMKVVVIDPLIEPLVLVRILAEHADAQLLRVFEEDEATEQEIRQAVLEAGLKILSWAPAASGLGLKAAAASRTEKQSGGSH